MFDALMVQLPAAFSVERLSEFVFNAVLNVTTAAIVFLSFMLFGDCCAVGWYLGSDSSLIKTGVQTAVVLTFLGVLSLTIGFALRDTLSTIISSFLVLVDRPFTIDDLVEVDGQYGRVEKNNFVFYPDCDCG